MELNIDASRSDRNRLTDGLKYELSGIEECRNLRDLQSRVQTRVAEQIDKARRARQLPLIIFGEFHNDACSTFVEMAIMKTVQEKHRGKATILIEDSEEAVNILRSKEVPVFNKKMPRNMSQPDVAAAQAIPPDLAAVAHTASKLGMTVAGFDTGRDNLNDTGRDNPNEMLRERQMVRAIRRHVRSGIETGDAVVVIAGLGHLFELITGLSKADTLVIPVTMVHEDMYHEMRTVRRLARISETLTNLSAMPLRVTSQLDAAPFNYIAAAKALGIDVSRHATAVL
jgi:hypothetical protein